MIIKTIDQIKTLDEIKPDDLISPGYRMQNELLHNEGCGRGGHNWANTVADLINLEFKKRVNSILDYGCGQGIFKKYLLMNDVRIDTRKQVLDFQEYEPSDPEKSDLPYPADLVVCNDILEHVEPELLDNVIDHLFQLTKVVGFITIGLNPSGAILLDGRNWHLTNFGNDHDAGRVWWTRKLMEWPWEVEPMRVRRDLWLELLVKK